MKAMAHRRSQQRNAERSGCLVRAVQQFTAVSANHKLDLSRSQRVSTSCFSFNFNGLSDRDCLMHFLFRKEDIIRMIPVVAWPESVTHTARNGYGMTAILATCILLRRLATPCRWHDLELLFGKHASHLSECFWETLECFMEARGNLVQGPMSSSFISRRAAIYAEAIHNKCGVMDNCIGFIDGTVIGIARPGGSMLQNVAYNGHKRKHSLKYQAVCDPDGLIEHGFGPMEGRRHNRALFVRSYLEEQLSYVLIVEGKQ